MPQPTAPPRVPQSSSSSSLSSSSRGAMQFTVSCFYTSDGRVCELVTEFHFSVYHSGCTGAAPPAHCVYTKFETIHRKLLVFVLPPLPTPCLQTWQQPPSLSTAQTSTKCALTGSQTGATLLLSAYIKIVNQEAFILDFFIQHFL
jgi:hypothetical protein